MQYFAICSAHNDIKIRRNFRVNVQEARSESRRDGTYVANLLIEANLFTGSERHFFLHASPPPPPLWRHLSFLRPPTFASHSSATSSRPFPHFADFNIRAHARGVLTSYYSGIPSRARLRTRFASIMRNVYPANGVEASRFLAGKGRGRVLGARRRKKEKKRERRGLSSYWRRIELRFLSNSEDRTNLKSAGSRRWILTTIRWHFAFMEMIGHGYSGISNPLVVYIVCLELPQRSGYWVPAGCRALSDYAIKFFPWFFHRMKGFLEY